VGTGRSWQGRSTDKARVLYVAAEGAFGLKGRADAWESGWQTTVADDHFDVLPRPVNLTNQADVREIIALVGWNGYGFVVFDTLARCMVGGDENSAKDCGEVVDALTKVREATPSGRGVVLGVHHTGKDGKTFRGSSAFEAGADTVYAVSLDGAVINLEREKRKDGPRDDMHELRFESIEGTLSGVINRHRSNGKQGGQTESLLLIFDRNFRDTGASKSDLRAAADMAPATFHRAIGGLLRDGLLINQGTAQRPFYVSNEA
jgi:AAA domain